jgi:DNA polymerase I
MTRAILLSAVTSFEYVVTLKFYEPITNKIISWTDGEVNKPYCYVLPTQLDEIDAIEGVENVTNVQLNNIVKDFKVNMSKVTCRDNNIIRQITESQPAWGTDIMIFQNYLYDNNFVIGKWYDLPEKGSTERPKVIESNTDIDLSKISRESVVDVPKFNEKLEKWAKLLSEEIPKIRRMAFDIEVQSSKGMMPDPNVADDPITAVGFVGDDIKKVFVLKREDVDMGELDPDTNYVFFDTEKELIEKSFEIIRDYPMILTFNGDTFDMPYMHNRAINIGIEKTPFKMMKKNATLNKGIHIDLYPVFKNRSLKIYAFSQYHYVENSLNAICEAVLGEKKTEYDGELNEIPLGLLGKYCQNDARLTHKLTTHGNDLVMNLLVILSKIANSPIDELSRRAISAWIKSMFYYEHKQNGDLIPRSSDFPDAEVSTKAMIKDKKYQGAIVQEPVKGIHFGVTVMDFASLYPSIIKTKNISYETIRCPHEECQHNIIPYTKHWACTKKSGIAALLIGSLKELRVEHFKPLLKKAKKEGNQNDIEKYDMITQALKVYLNASYGVIGAETFDLYYLPTAESVTAVGRDIITNTANFSKERDMKVIYGDTDSLFYKQPTEQQIQDVIKFTERKYAIDLEVDKEYKYLVLSDRKKNYFGVKIDGNIDVKGLTGKKSHTPPFLKTLFNKILDELKTIDHIEQFDPVKVSIRKMIKEKVEYFDDIPIEELAFNVQINKNPQEYDVKPQVLKAAEQLVEKPHQGQFVQYVKTWTQPKVKPTLLVRRDEVDKPKYIEAVEKTLEQITDPMGIDFDVILGKGRKTELDEWF